MVNANALPYPEAEATGGCSPEFLPGQFQPAGGAAMRVVVEPHDPRWAEHFTAESRRIGRALDQVVADVHHVTGTRTHHIHVLASGSPEIGRHLAWLAAGRTKGGP